MLLCASCGKNSVETDPSTIPGPRRDLAELLSRLPIGEEQMNEVYDAVETSSSNGYDEEYLMSDLLSAPGSGVGTKASTEYSRPIRALIEEYLATHPAPVTKAGAADAQEYLDMLQSSGMQIYWPYSEDWDGSTAPVITFDPGNGAESNYGFRIGNPDEEILVTEAYAREHPVWVVNSNTDSGYTTLDQYFKGKAIGDEYIFDDDDDEDIRCLYIRDFTMLRHYDPWFAGASEFWCKCGAVSGFRAGTEEELKRYTPEVTDFVVVVKRGELGRRKQFNAVLVSDFTSQLDNLAFLITEDDGGTLTSWKCSASVKIKSKTWGFDIDIPLHQHDDIVWRGQLSAKYFEQNSNKQGRFGDVMVTFALE